MCLLICKRISSMCFSFFFFFKQKTAYDITVRDWSSDVCSSDLQRLLIGRQLFPRRRHRFTGLLTLGGRCGRGLRERQRTSRKGGDCRAATRHHVAKLRFSVHLFPPVIVWLLKMKRRALGS